MRPTERRRIDGVGMLLLIVAVGAIALAIVESGSPAWQRSELWIVAATGVVAGVGFVVWARHAAAPLVDLALFRHRTYSYVNVATLAFGTAFSIMFLAFFFYMTDGLALQPAAGRAGHHAGAAAGDADGHHHRPSGRTPGPSAASWSAVHCSTPAAAPGSCWYPGPKPTTCATGCRGW